jgi:hypothetical protein
MGDAGQYYINTLDAISGDFLKHDGTRFIPNVPKSIGWFGFGYNASGNTVIYHTIPPHGNFYTNATESIVDLIFDYAFTVKRIRLNSPTNTRNGNTIISFRDDGADATGATVTIGSTATGEFDSGALSAAVAAGSRINWKVDPTAGSSGNLLCMGWLEYEVLLQ